MGLMLCSLLSRVSSSGMLMETARLPPPNATQEGTACAAGQLRAVSLDGVTQCGLFRPHASHQSPRGSHRVEEAGPAWPWGWQGCAQ